MTFLSTQITEIVQEACVKIGKVDCIYPFCGCKHPKLMIAAIEIERRRCANIARNANLLMPQTIPGTAMIGNRIAEAIEQSV